MAGPITSATYPIGDVDYRTAIDVLATDLGKTWNQTEMWMDTHLGTHTQSAAAEYLRSQGWQYVQSPSGRAFGWQQTGTIQFNTAVQDSLNSNLGSVTTGKFNLLAKTQWIQDTLGRDIVRLGKGVWGTDVNKYALTGPIGVAAAAVMTGAKLGKFVAGTLYQNSPDVWDATGMGTMNPETWASITRDDDSWNAQLVNFLLGIDGDTGETTGYMDETALAYFAQYLASLGAFNPSTDSSTSQDYIDQRTRYFYYSGWNPPIYSGNTFTYETSDNLYMFTATNVHFVLAKQTMAAYPQLFMISNGPATVHRMRIYKPDGSEHPANYTLDSYTLRGRSPTQFYYYSDFLERSSYLNLSLPINEYTMSGTNATDMSNDLVQFIIYGDTIGGGGVEGIDPQPDSTNPDITGWDNPADTLASLKQQYPTWWDDAITNTTANPDGTTTTTTYVPVPFIDGMFNSVNDNQPTNTDRVSGDTAVNPDTAPEDLLKLITEVLLDLQPRTDPETQPESQPDVPISNPPTTGDGDTPPSIVPTGGASSLYAIYNPTQQEVNDFGAWLWSPNFVDQLLKLFNDPMQAIIGLHKVFATPIIGGRQNIKVGYLDSGVASNTVADQYTVIDCGSVSLPEYFGNVFDYSPFTDVSIFLPFIGFRPLNVADIMRSTISVKYSVDVLSGACLAEVSVIRDGAGGVLYTYSGNCAVQYPLSSGSYMGIIATIAGVATSAVAGAAAGGPAGAAVAGGMSALHGSGTRVGISGNISGNAGAMGVKKPYLVISRPQPQLASTFPNQQGYPTNYSATLGSYSGFVQCRAMHVESTCATQAEISEIQSLLSDGVIV